MDDLAPLLDDLVLSLSIEKNIHGFGDSMFMLRHRVTGLQVYKADSIEKIRDRLQKMHAWQATNYNPKIGRRYG